MILSRYSGLENLQTVAGCRIGQLTANRYRPLKIVLQRKAHHKYFLVNAKHIHVQK